MTLFLCVTCVVGCGASTTPQDSPSKAADAEKPKPEGAKTPNTNAAAESAAQQVRAALSALRNGHPDELWRRLPTQYRSEVQDLLRQARLEIDAGSWKAGFETAGRTAGLIDGKAAWLASHPRLQPTAFNPGAPEPNQGETEATWRRIAALLRTLAECELADPDDADQLDVESFLAGTGRTLVGRLSEIAGSAVASNVRDDLAKITVEPVSSNGDRAVLRIGGAAYDEVEHTFVRVGETWIPETLVEAWPGFLATARTTISAAGESADAFRDRLAAFDALLDDLETASDEAAFHARIDAALESLAPTPPPDPATVTADDVATVTVTGRLTAEDDERLQLLFNAAADDPDLAVSVSRRAGDDTRFEVSHVGDVFAFAKRLAVADAITVDEVVADERGIRITYRVPSAQP